MASMEKLIPFFMKTTPRETVTGAYAPLVQTKNLVSWCSTFNLQAFMI